MMTPTGQNPSPFFCFVGGSRTSYHAAPHWHYYMELIQVLEGHAEMTAGGERYVLGQGDLLLVGPREVHTVKAPDGVNFSHLVLKFHPDVITASSHMTFEARYIVPFILTTLRHNKVIRFKDIENTDIPSILKDLRQECREKEYGYEIAVYTDIARIFLWMIRFWKNRGVHPSDPYPLGEEDLKNLEKVFDHVDKNFQENLTAGAAARLCKMSPACFSRFFKKQTGKTFKGYVNYIRIIEAQKLLLSTDKNVTRTAMDIGYSNVSYFIRQFRLYCGVSPKKFKQNPGSS